METIPRISTPRDETARESYRQYLQTPGWRRRRNRALGLAHWQCQKCSARRGLQVHHLTYERLGSEHDQDLEVLCRDCHEGHHMQQMEESPKLGVYLKLAGEVQREHIFHS